MDMKHPQRTVKNKFLMTDKIIKGAKTVGKPIVYAAGTLGLLVLKDQFTSKDNNDNKNKN